MSIKPSRTRGRRLDPDEQVEAAFTSGLPEDISSIDCNPVRSKLAPKSQLKYDNEYVLWKAYKRKFPEADPRTMQCMKHFAELVGRSTVGRLDEGGMATVKTVRNKVRIFMSQWERENHQSIPPKVHESMAPYIKDHLGPNILLSKEEKAPTFLTIQNYLEMEELLWQKDYHNYIHEGSRVDLSTLLKMHCYTSARLQEICQAKYKDLVCIVAWKDGEPEIKLSFKREKCKNMAESQKKPKHPIYERLDPAPPLLANPLLFLLSIIISSNAFKNYKTVEDVLSARAPKGKYRIMAWAHDVLDIPVFPEMSMDGPTEKAKNDASWGKQCSEWARRADFPNGMGLHAARREALIQVDDGGYSLGQVMKFAAHRNPKTLVGHYLDDMSNVDGAAAFLKLKARGDLTEDFRSASMGKTSDIQHSLAAKNLQDLKQRQDYMDLSEQLQNLVGKEFRTQRRYLYDQRQKLVDKELENQRNNPHRVHNTDSNGDQKSEWQRSYFDRVVRHMAPERDRLANTLLLAASLRSPEGISALRDLVALRTNDSTVAYQEVLRPVKGCCPVPTCSEKMKDIAVKDRWKHVYECYKLYHQDNSGFAEFCFQCSQWITSKEDWEDHCEHHIDNFDLPFRCDPVIFRRADACAGYCSRCLGNTSLLATQRMQQFSDRTSWQRHIAKCIPDYVESLDGKESIPCPHPLCCAILCSESELWCHLDDSHSTSKPNPRKRKGKEDGRVDISSAKKRKRPNLQTRPKNDDSSCEFVNMSAKSFHPGLADVIDMKVVSRSSSPYYSTSTNSIWDGPDDNSDDLNTDTSLSDDIFDAFSNPGDECQSPWETPLEGTNDAEPWNPDEVTHGSSLSGNDWTLPGCDTPPCVSNDLKEVIDPRLLDDFSHSVSGLSSFANSPEKYIPGNQESTTTQPLCSSQGLESQPVAINAEDGVWEVEALLAKSKERNTTWYLVKWKGFAHGDNTWEKRNDISLNTIESFEATYKGNCSGVQLLEKRKRQGRVEYLVQWKGRPEVENSWVKEGTVSIERIMEFEAS
ncbi:hypothetical protein VE00_10781 [Pseudogymnoascus sp. WSF 3629]|nr:hypothetical protein VE00_10781 [Pseudogymnoascus sp. WSF 3629]